MAKNNKAESYWERRSIELEEKWNTRSRETIEKELAVYYRQALQHIQKDIEALYGTFSKDNKVSMTEARKILQGDEYRVWRMDIKEYIREIEKLAAAGAVSKSNELLRELNTLAMRSRITRLDKLYAETLAELGRLAGKTEAGMDKFLTDAYKDGYYRNLYEIGKKTGLKSIPSKADSSKVENVLRTPWSGKNYSQRIWGNDAKLGERIKETLTQGIHRGSSIGQLSRQLADRMGVGFHDAERLVRTELNYVQNKAALEGIKDAGMGFYRFVATLDNRTTQKCISHDGHVFPVEEASPGDNMPPLHARCRSTICASLGEEGSRGGRRLARNKDGRNIRVPEEMRYNDWKAVYIDKSKSWAAWKQETGYNGRVRFASGVDFASQGGDVGGIIKSEGGAGLEQSKKRDHKILITDVAIGKVPYVEIPGYTKDFCNDIQLKHKDILKIAQTQNASNEVAVVYNLHTNEKVFILGDEFHVDVESDINVKVLQSTAYAQELVMCHNHPSTSNFSFADIDYFIANEYLALMSIVTNQGEVYILYKSSAYDYDKIREIEHALIKKCSLDVQEEIAAKFLKQCWKGGVVYVKGK